jgi:hypothetical protein
MEPKVDRDVGEVLVIDEARADALLCLQPPKGASSYQSIAPSMHPGPTWGSES